jgi:hypothetical protein
MRFGSFSHAGPPEVEADKGNQDFAFHLDLRAPDGSCWALVGVADGVSQATWSSRAARHACAAFIESVAALSSAPTFPSTAVKLARDDWPDVLSRVFHEHLRARMEGDRHFLFEGKYLDPTWAAQAYRDKFLSGSDAFASTAREWFQTTLLAAALGPEGGFALLLGDGYARIDRRFSDGRVDRGAGLDRTSMISLSLTQAQVREGIVRLAPKGAIELGVLLATDGVSRSLETAVVAALHAAALTPSPGADPPLDRVSFPTSEVCGSFLDALAREPAADRDNMSVAFAVRSLMAPEVP